MLMVMVLRESKLFCEAGTEVNTTQTMRLLCKGRKKGSPRQI